jgi:hypothetical protein
MTGVVYAVEYCEDHECHGVSGLFTTVDKAKAFVPHVEWERPKRGEFDDWDWSAFDRPSDTFYMITRMELDPEPVAEEFYPDGDDDA